MARIPRKQKKRLKKQLESWYQKVVLMGPGIEAQIKSCSYSEAVWIIIGACVVCIEKQ